uniref:NADP-dependent oxidoreductase domain-containing protein n=1 Tax=Strigamia maritima TaxID=126957 RepID=T1J1D6_STRMM
MADKISVPRVKLSNDAEIPIIGLGTWKSEPEAVKNAVKDAIDIGYRHFDCALAYENEDQIGDAIKEKIDEGVVVRKDLFITSKAWNTYHPRKLVKDGLKNTLSNLKMEYLDLYLIHWPIAYKEGTELFPKDESGKIVTSDVDYLETWKGLEDCCREGMVRNIGLSNFNSVQIQRILDICEIKPVMLQVECNPYLNQEKLFQFCKDKKLALTAYSCLGSPARPWVQASDPVLLNDPVILNLASKHSKTSAQICLRYLIQRGIVVIPKSTNRGRIESNFNVFDFELPEEDIISIKSLNRNFRAVALEWIKDHPHYPFNAAF